MSPDCAAQRLDGVLLMDAELRHPYLGGEQQAFFIQKAIAFLHDLAFLAQLGWSGSAGGPG